MIKCVVWDLDRTLLDGVMLERDGGAVLADGMADVLSALHERGILNSVASRNPAELAERVVAQVDWPAPLVHPQYSWSDKSASIARIAELVGIGLDTIAFVDDDPFERAEVAAALPQVVTLSPEDVTGALDWPEFTPPVVTAEGRARAQTYLDAQRRTAAAADFGGSREEFLRSCGTTVTLRRAGADDVDRLHEMSVRTTQFNSAGAPIDRDVLARRVADGGVVCLTLSDAFGDDGMVGGVVVDPSWRVDLLMMSCRAMGRGVSEVLLNWLVTAAAAAGAGQVRIPLRVNERNVPLRVAMVAAGFRAEPGTTEFTRATDGDPPPRPDWVTVVATP